MFGADYGQRSGEREYSELIRLVGSIVEENLSDKWITFTFDAGDARAI